MKSRLTLFILALFAVPAFAFAQTAADTAAANVSVTATVPGATVSAGVSVDAKAVARGDQEIDRRVQNLNAVSARVAQMQKISDEGKSQLTAAITAQVSDLTALRAKIDADTTLTDLKTDVQSITASYRVYALLLPQIRIVASSDRAATIADQMTTLESKLATRIAGTSGDTSALVTADTDMKAKIVDADTQASAAVSEVAVLEPDNGDTTVMASNTAALKDAQAKVKVATADLVAARKDITTIVAGLQASASASANTSASATTP